MAVNKRSYKAYSGAILPAWSRFLVIPRFAWASLFQQRFLTILYVICFFFPVGAALAIYLNYNMSFLRQYVNLPESGFLKVDGRFFFVFTSVQSTLAFLLTAFIGPGLISPDLLNNSLPLYFCRPISRTQYVAGKMLVLAGLLSTITWIPGLLLFALQASLGGGPWIEQHYWIAGSLLAGNLLYIVVISLLAMALSAWVRWKIIAGALMLVVLFVGAGLAEMIREVGRSDIGAYLNITNCMVRVWMQLFQVRESFVLSLEEAVLALLAFCGLCLLLISRKVKAYEVVRG